MPRNRWRSFDPVSSVRETVQIVRAVSLDDLHYSALSLPCVVVVAESVPGSRALTHEIFGVSDHPGIVAAVPGDEIPDDADVVLLAPDVAHTPLSDMIPVVIAGHDATVPDVRRLLIARAGDHALALGRTFPALRTAAAMDVIRSTSRSNAQFALASNLPALIPVVGGLLAGGADTVVLTKNQLLMLYQLAAIHGRDLDDRTAIYREMVPVVGAGMLWRTAARDLATMVAFAGGAVPKVAIAFTGTFVAGMAAHAFYMEGKRASVLQRRDHARQALQELWRIPAMLPSGWRDGD